jgi:transcriptional regulator with XRE-family HTH domain
MTSTDSVTAPYPALGERLRRRRQEAGLSLRELARRIGVSASLISQIETDKVQPSVATLYALVRELGGSFDEIMFGEPPQPAQEAVDGEVETLAAALTSAMLVHPPVPLVQRAHERKALHLTSGVRWERLTRESVPGMEFLFVVYEPGAESGPPGEFQRHSGREWCYVISGVLDIVVGFDAYVLQPGDSITYDSTVPHRLTNTGTEPVQSVWFQLG